ncbi:MAG: hypothetical protein FD163_819 [Hyphomonadaceae bacterium]|nr:MAG: hypothetical protein FD128_1779 [Hyphomonadaceae bacterium]KAF0186151.1 MAG: hypothetical protein FD163_819 [Hyphomonadaceae bacterium]
MAGEFKPTEAATSVFTFIKAYPAFVARFVLFSIAATLPWIIYFVFVSGKIIEHVGLDGRNWEDIEAFRAMLSQINALPLLIATAIFWFALSIATQAMAIRKTVLNQETGILGLAWGGFETRLSIICIIFSFAPLLIFWPLFKTFAIMADGTARIEALVAPLVLFCIAFLFFIPFFIYAIGRWGLYGICALQENNFGIKAAGKVSKGRFWVLFGAFALTYLIWMVISGIFQNLGRVLLGLHDVVITDPTEFAEFMALFTPELISKFSVYMLVLMIIGALMHLAYICTGAFAYLKIKQAEAANHALEETK